MISFVNDNRPRWVKNWLDRHQTSVSFWLHMVGIPLTIAAVALAIWQLVQWRWDLWYRPIILLMLGYALQYAGHRYEGNDMGEVILVKRLLAKPYVAIAPQYDRADNTHESGQSGSSAG